MIEKSPDVKLPDVKLPDVKLPDVKLLEQADSLIDEFRESVLLAQKHARESGVDYTFVENGIRYVARPNGDIEKLGSVNGE